MYDAIVIGARCAGSPTAMLLARRGYRVLLMDKATFPSDMVMSTHWIQQSGVAFLKRWALLERIRSSNCPAITKMSFDFGPFTLAGCPTPAGDVTEAFCPRRTILDKILVDAAVDAGAELCEGCLVNDLVWNGEHVTGIRATRKGSSFTAEARIVIGADGMHSTVARAVGAPEYNTRPEIMFTYFSYWSGVVIDGIEAYLRDYRAVYAWMTNDGLALVGVNWPFREHERVRKNAEENYLKEIKVAAPELAERIRSGKREAKWLTGSVTNFFRRPYGPGWALVGDAGYKKDPVTAAGITDAFRDAESLVVAIDEGFSGTQPLEDAFAKHQRRRDEGAMPFYKFTCNFAQLAPPTAEQTKLFEALSGNQAETNRFLGVIAQTVPVPEFFAPENIERILSAT